VNAKASGTASCYQLEMKLLSTGNAKYVFSFLKAKANELLSTLAVKYHQWTLGFSSAEQES